MNPIKDIVAGLGEPIQKIIGDLADNKIQKGTAIVQLQHELSSAEASADQAAAAVIMAEAKGESWLQRSWRPIAALSFVALFMAFPILFAFGIDPKPLGEALATIPNNIVLGVFSMVGGYIGLRSFRDKGSGQALDALVNVMTKQKKGK